MERKTSDVQRVPTLTMVRRTVAHCGRIAAPPPIQERLPAEDAIRNRHHETSRTPLKAGSASMTITTARWSINASYRRASAEELHEASESAENSCGG